MCIIKPNCINVVLMLPFPRLYVLLLSPTNTAFLNLLGQLVKISSNLFSSDSLFVQRDVDFGECILPKISILCKS